VLSSILPRTSFSTNGKGDTKDDLRLLTDDKSALDYKVRNAAIAKFRAKY